MDLDSNSVIITDAIKYVNGKMDHLNKQEKKTASGYQGEEAELKLLKLKMSMKG